MGFKVYGVLAAQSPDKSDEVINIKNVDTSNLRYVNDEHSDRQFDMIGAVTKHKKIFSEQECEDVRQQKCWNIARVPFIYVEGELADETGHPNAQAAAALIKFTASRPDIPLKLGWSVEGGIVERLDRAGKPTEDKEQGKYLNKTIATGATITVKPCNSKAVLFPMVDLKKSIAVLEFPVEYYEKLEKSMSEHSFVDIYWSKLANTAEELHKSLEDYWGGFTAIKCHFCGEPHRFFKSTKDMPNGCPKCGEPFRLKQIWESLNK